MYIENFIDRNNSKIMTQSLSKVIFQICFFLLVLFMSIVRFFIPSSAAAFEFYDPEIPYRANRQIQIDGQTYRGRVWHHPGITREELIYNNKTQTVILNFRGNSAIILLAQPKLAVEVPLDRAKAMFSTLPDDVSDINPRGTTSLHGIPVTEYQVKADLSDSEIWMSDEGIVLRLVGKSKKNASFSMELNNLYVGPQKRDLFEIPKDYKHMYIDNGTITGLNLQSLINRTPKFSNKNQPITQKIQSKITGEDQSPARKKKKKRKPTLF